MATDATGTPTSKGIPKYDTANDAPSGLGFNAAMDAIDSLLGWIKLRKNSTGTIFSRGRLNLIEGTGVTITVADDPTDNEIDVTIASTASGPGYGTSLPGSPADGDEYILVDSTTAPTYQWRFRYNASASGAYKWEFVGGTPGYHEVDADETTASGTYAALATAGPLFAIPRAGVYVVEIGATAYVTAGAPVAVYMSYDIGVTGAVDADRLIWTIAGNSYQITGMRANQQTLTAVTLTAKYRTDSAVTGHWVYRWMRVTPIRVS